ncbi:uncharacterized protein LOC131597351 [Vicia villosa]|uniref:uncharacterized protein LOC131597351 n=1 Tax=Vicia villosa TaxID=3911 RepID=UPI00273CDA84|nr:uncharacterized protein LOC131597351 [Vicia villosa]
MTKKETYTGIGQEVKVVDLAKALGIPITDLVPHYKTNGDLRGIKRTFLEAQAMAYAQKKKWEITGNIWALLMFGVVLLPKNVDYVDSAAIHVFYSVKVFGKDPTPTILANIYYTLHTRCVKKKGMKLNYGSIIYRCGEYHNVPLIGTNGCINYNPMLALRQLGHSMNDKTSEEQIRKLILHDMGKEDPRELKKVIHAWSHVLRKDFGPKNVIAKEPYVRWVTERVKKNLLPFVVDPTYKSHTPDQGLLSVEERLRAALEASQREKEGLELQVHQLTNERSQLRLDLKDRDTEL